MSELQWGLLLLGVLLLLGFYGHYRWRSRADAKLGDSLGGKDVPDLLLDGTTSGDNRFAAANPVLEPYLGPTASTTAETHSASHEASAHAVFAPTAYHSAEPIAFASEPQPWDPAAEAATPRSTTASAPITASAVLTTTTEPALVPPPAPPPLTFAPFKPPLADEASLHDIIDVISLHQDEARPAPLPPTMALSAAATTQPPLEQPTAGEAVAAEARTTAKSPVKRLDPWPPRKAVTTRPPDEPLLHPIVDFIAEFASLALLSSEAMFEACLASPERFDKPVRMSGWNEETQQWEWCFPGQPREFTRIQIGLQTVNRQGAVSEAELTDFIKLMKHLSKTLHCEVVLPSISVYSEQAKSLDEFCAAIDKQVAINLVCSPNREFPGTKVRGMAEAAGMTLKNGRFTRFSAEDGRAMFHLQDLYGEAFSQESLRSNSFRGLTFLLDVPHLLFGLEEFEHMLRIAHNFAQSLAATIIDENGETMTQGKIAHIRDEYIIRPHSKMRETPIIPGSPLALRLFA